MQYNGDSTQAKRVPLHCKMSRRLMMRVSAAGDWPVDLRQWVWCKGCHVEHEVTKEHIEEARAQDVRRSTARAMG